MPRHEIIPNEREEEVLKLLGATKKQLPKISRDDPVIEEIGAEPGEIIKITRNSFTAGTSIYFRLVI